MVILNLLYYTSFLDDFVYAESETVDNCQCYHMTASSTTMDWKKNDSKDKSTQIIMPIFDTIAKPSWTPALVQHVEVEDRVNLKASLIYKLHDKLVLYKPIFNYVKYIGLIIVSLSLRRIIFSHYHAGPSGGHMGEYKTLFRIRTRFYWPGVRKDIKLWIKICAHCVAYDIWRNRKSELYFS